MLSVQAHPHVDLANTLHLTICSAFESGVCVTRPHGFEMRPRHATTGKHHEVRMVKIRETADGGLKSEPSRHSTFCFSCDGDREAQRWIRAIKDFTMDETFAASQGPTGMPPRLELATLL